MAHNAEASSSRRNDYDEHDEVGSGSEPYGDRDIDGGDVEEDEFQEWDDDEQDDYGNMTDSGGSGDDYIEDGSDDGSPRRGVKGKGKETDEEAGQQEEDDAEGGFDRLANVLKDSMAAPREARADVDDNMFMNGLTDTAGIYSGNFGKEIAALENEAEDGLFGDFQGRVLRPNKKQPKSAPKGKRKYRRNNHIPSPEVAALIGQANLAYIQSQFAEAIPILLEVIRIDPKIHSAWQTMAVCHQELGNTEQSLQCNLLAAHLDGDAQTWKDLAQRSAHHPVQALYCIKKALKLAPDDSEALYEAARMFLREGDKAKAFTHFKKLVETSSQPHDFSILLEMRPLLYKDPKNLEMGCRFYREAFEYHLLNFSGPNDQRQDTVNNLTINSLIVLVDVLMETNDFESAVNCIKRGQRWLDGRYADQQWALREDDLEYVSADADPPGGGCHLDRNLRHRLALARLKLGDDDQAFKHTEVILALDVAENQQLFKEIGEALMVRGHYQSALEVFDDIIESEDIPYIASVVVNFGLCQQQLGAYDAAIGAFEHVVQEDPDNFDVWMKLATAAEEAGDKEKALYAVSQVIERRGNNLAQPMQRGQALEDEPEPEGNDAGSAFIRGVIRRKKNRIAIRKAPNRQQELHQAAVETRALWEDVKYAEQGVTDGMSGAIDAFIEASGDMIEIFRMAKGNFGKDRGVKRITMKTKRKRDAEAGTHGLDEQAREMQSRLEATSDAEDDPEAEQESNSKDKITVQQTHFHGISAKDWLALIVKHCCVLMAKGDGESALDVLEHVVNAGIFYTSHDSSVALRLTALAVAMRMRDCDKILEHEHQLSYIMQYRIEPKLILLGCLGHGHGPSAAFTSGPLQKRIHRELRLYNSAVDATSLKWYPGRRRWVLDDFNGDGHRKKDRGGGRKTVVEDEDDEDVDIDPKTERRNEPILVTQERPDPDGPPIRHNVDPSMSFVPTKRHPLPYITYGLNMMAQRTYHSAFYYFLRAYELDPYHPYLSLLIAQCYFGRSMNRQSDNKNYQIAEGLAFLVRYRRLSPPEAELEVEYNYGRAFHSIGVTHLAVNHYEKVLQLTEAQMEAAEDPKSVLAHSVAREAAYNLVLIYSTSGSIRLARERSRKWLAI